MKSIRFKQFISLVLIFIMSFTTYGGSALANQSDIVGHWAEKQIQTSIEKGFVKGFPDGKFRPDAEITRAEFISLVNRKFMYTGKSKNVFPDVKANEWYANEVSAALAAGYIGGFEDGTMRPKAEITRQEVAAILTRILKLSKNDNAAKHFKDSIPTWSKGSIGAVSENKIMTGLPGVKFGPMKPITRAEAIVTLDRIPDPKISYNKAGTYGPKTGFETITNNVEITTDGVVLQNLVIVGNLHITKSVGEGDVILKNVTVKGITTINGGGENSIHAENSTLNHVIVDKDNDKVRLVITGTSTISQVTLRSGAKLEEKDVTKNGFGSIIVNAPKDSRIDLKGKFESVTIDSSDATVNLDAGSSVEKLTINKKATVTGNGTINQANVNADGVDLKITPAKVTVKDGVKYPGTTTPGTGGGEGGTVISPPPTSGGGDDNGTPPTGVTIERIEDITKNASVGEKIQLPSTVKAKMSNGTEVDKPIVWSGKAYTGDVGSFEYEGAVEGYNRIIKYTLNVVMSGYEESADGKVATVSSDAALIHAQNVITVEKVVINKDVTLPKEFNLPITVHTPNLKVNLNGNNLEEITINGDNTTLINGTIQNISYGTGVKSVTLKDIKDVISSSHELTNIKLNGSTNIHGELKLKGKLEGDTTALVSGIVRVETAEPVTISVPASTVIVDYNGAIVYIANGVKVENMMVRQNATINYGSGATITNPEKRDGVEVTESSLAKTAAFRAQVSNSNFKVAVDTTDLARYIDVSENFIAAAKPGALDGQFPQSAITNLTNAKDQAKVTLNNATSPAQQGTVDFEVTSLKQELTIFSSLRIFLDTSSLKNNLRAMEQLLARTTIGTTHGHVPQEAYNAFEKVVKEVRQSLELGLTSEKMEQQMTKLTEAHEIFKAAYIDLPFFDPETSTIEGSISFKLPDADKGEVFTDFASFKIYDEKNKDYSGTGWGITVGDVSNGWTEMEVIKLNHHDIDLNTVDKVYYTIASNKNIYTGSYTVADFKKHGEVKLTKQNEETGILKIEVENVPDDFVISHIGVSKLDQNQNEKWETTYEVASTTNLPTGKYRVEVYSYDKGYEYILNKKEITVNKGQNLVKFLKSEMDTITLSYEDFTGWNMKAYEYRAYESLISNHNRFILDEEARTLNSKLKMTSDYSGLDISYYANHPKRDGEQWRYNIGIERKKNGEDEAIKTSPHFKFNVELNEDGKIVDPKRPLYESISLDIVNDFGHRLYQIDLYHDYSYLATGGKITVKDSAGRTGTKSVSSIWELNMFSIEQILSGAKGKVEITFELEETPFLIPPKTITVDVGN